MHRTFPASAGVLAAALLATACSVHHSYSSLDWDDLIQVERTEDHPLELAAGGSIAVDLRGGDVRLRCVPGAEPSLRARVRAAGRTQALAQELLDKTRLVLGREGETVTVRMEQDEVDQGEDGVRLVLASRVDLDVVLPEDVRCRVTTSSGDVAIEGPVGSCAISTRYGDVQVRDAQDGLDITTASGDVAVARVRGGALRVSSSYGDLELATVDVETVEAATRSGDIAARDVQARSIGLVSSYGDLRIAQLRGELEATTRSGEVELEDVEGGRIAITSSYGHLSLSGCRAPSIAATTSSGRVGMQRVTGSVKAASRYGAVAIDGIVDGLDVNTSSGAITIEAREGSRLDGPWKLVSGYGDVTLIVPSDLAFDLDASTNYGEIDVGLPILVPAGGREKGRKLQGQVGGGGPRIEMTTRNGDVEVRPRG